MKDYTYIVEEWFPFNLLVGYVIVSLEEELVEVGLAANVTDDTGPTFQRPVMDLWKLVVYVTFKICHLIFLLAKRKESCEHQNNLFLLFLHKMFTESSFFHKYAEKILADCYAFVQWQGKSEFLKWSSDIRQENKFEQTLATWWSNVDCFANLFSHLPFVHLEKNCKNFITIRNPNCFNYTKGSERRPPSPNWYNEHHKET